MHLLRFSLASLIEACLKVLGPWSLIMAILALVSLSRVAQEDWDALLERECKPAATTIAL